MIFERSSHQYIHTDTRYFMLSKSGSKSRCVLIPRSKEGTINQCEKWNFVHKLSKLYIKSFDFFAIHFDGTVTFVKSIILVYCIYTIAHQIKAE